MGDGGATGATWDDNHEPKPHKRIWGGGPRAMDASVNEDATYLIHANTQ
jgi:hypothetical protein